MNTHRSSALRAVTVGFWMLGLVASCGAQPEGATYDAAAPDDRQRAPRDDAWERLEAPRTHTLLAVGGDATRVFIVGDNGDEDGAHGIVLQGGAEGRLERVGLPAAPECRPGRCRWRCVSVDPAGEALFAGANQSAAAPQPVMTWDGRTARPVEGLADPYFGWFSCVSGGPGERALGGGYGVVALQRGGVWSIETVDEDPQRNPYFRGWIAGLWRLSGAALWAVGGDESGHGAAIFAREGDGWRAVSRAPARARYEALWAADAETVIAVGGGGQIDTLSPRGVSSRTVGSATLRGVWGRSARDVWAVGDGGTVLHFDGAAWSRVEVPTRADLYGVWGRGERALWIVGADGTALSRR